MPYITIKQSPIYYQISLDEILDKNVDLSRMIVPNVTNTRTYYRKEIKQSFLDRFDFDLMIETLKSFNEQNAALFEVEDRNILYNTFYIPKKSGGLREINAPVPTLMNALRNLKTIFESNMFALYHTSAFAYVKGRCTVDCVKRHQQNESKWFAKLDFSDFFGSTTEEFVLSMFSMIFPFSEIVKRPTGLEALKKALSLCFLNGGLPQGTPISPLITNVMMIPIDHKISNDLRNFASPQRRVYYTEEFVQPLVNRNRNSEGYADPTAHLCTKKVRHEEILDEKITQHLIYTRYADDILVSGRQSFDYKELQDYILKILKKFNAPFALKREKTRYGSSAGRNWNLGIMLNKDNEMTIGYQKKKIFKAMCCNYVCDKKKNISWDLHDVQVFAGLISYYRMIEKNYINYIIDQINAKFQVNLEALVKEDLGCQRDNDTYKGWQSCFKVDKYGKTSID